MRQNVTGFTSLEPDSKIYIYSMSGTTEKSQDQIASAVVEHVDAMLAYWDKDLLCRFANDAYLQWFGKSPEEMIGKMRMPDILGPLFEKNLPYITGALKGERQTFEREIQTPTGLRHSLANYYPDFSGDEVLGFYVHVADITLIKSLSQERERLIEQLQNALKEIRTLTGLLPICAWCKNVRDDKGYWSQLETYISAHSSVLFTHSICDSCYAKVLAKKESLAEGV